MMPSTRRRLLAAAGTSLAAVAGCTTLERARRWVEDERRDPPERRVDPGWTPDAGTWPGWRYGPANTGHNPNASPPDAPPALAWTRDLEDGVDRLVVAEGRVLVSTGREVAALDPADGTVVWRRDVDGYRAIRYVDGRLYELGRETLWARTPDDDLVWRLDHDEWLEDFREWDGYLFVGTSGGSLTVHADTGDVVREHNEGFRTAATDGQRLYAGIRTRLFAYDPADRALEERWSTDATGYDVYGSPVVGGDSLHVPENARPARDGPTSRLSRYGRDGKRRASEAFDQTPMGVAVADGAVFVGTAEVSADALGSDGRLVALAADGTRRWEVDLDGSAAAPVLADGVVYAGPFANDDVPLTARDAESGEELWRREAAVSARETVDSVRLAAAGDTLYVGDADSVRAFRP